MKSVELLTLLKKLKTCMNEYWLQIKNIKAAFRL